MEERKTNSKSVLSYIKQNAATSVMLGLFAAFCFGSLIYFSVIGHARDAFLAFLPIIILPIFWLADKITNFYVPPVFTAIVVVFMVFNVLGGTYNFYTYIPKLDDILHAVWGIVFVALGFMLIKSFSGEPNGNKNYIVYAIFGFAFAILSSVVWEILEFTVDRLFSNFDMQEDTVVNSINSFLLYPEYDHLHTLKIDGIAYTVLYDADGNELYRIEGGYLDIGIFDTMWDMIWCFVAAFVFDALLIVDRFAFKGVVDKLVIPHKKQPVISEIAEEKEGELSNKPVASDIE